MPGDDIALKITPRGKYTFVWKGGNPVFDRRGQYAVLVTLCTKKGWYYWDSTGKFGTLLYTVKQDRLSTGSQLASYCADAGQQCQAAGVITKLTAVPTRLRPGVWQVKLDWEAAGQHVTERIRV